MYHCRTDPTSFIVAMRRAAELSPQVTGIHRALGMMEAALGNRAEGVAQVQLAERLNSNPQPSLLTAYGYRVVGLHDDATRVAKSMGRDSRRVVRSLLRRAR